MGPLVMSKRYRPATHPYSLRGGLAYQVNKGYMAAI
jgi:hypothetical protein